MNIENTTILSLLPQQPLADGLTLSLPISGQELPANFTEALLGQLKTLSNGSELTKATQAIATPENLKVLQSLPGLIGQEDFMQKLTVFLGKELPAATGINNEMDMEALVASLIESQNPEATNIISSETPAPKKPILSLKENNNNQPIADQKELPVAVLSTETTEPRSVSPTIPEKTIPKEPLNQSLEIPEASPQLLDPALLRATLAAGNLELNNEKELAVDKAANLVSGKEASRDTVPSANRTQLIDPETTKKADSDETNGYIFDIASSILDTGTAKESIEFKLDDAAKNPEQAIPEQIDKPAVEVMASTIVSAALMAEQSINSAKNKEFKVVNSPESGSLVKLQPQISQFEPSVLSDKETPVPLLQKNTGETPSKPGNPEFDLNIFEKAANSQNHGSTESELVSGLEKNLPKSVSDMGPVNRAPAEIKVELPALTKPVSHPGWNHDLGERILWMSSRSITAAEIKLNPQHLGPISIRVDINQDQASVSFSAQHTVVRDALEASIPKLREMMSTQQLNLMDVNVSQHFSSDQGRPQQQNFAQNSARTHSGQESIDNLLVPKDEFDKDRAIVTQGLLSLYA